MSEYDVLAMKELMSHMNKKDLLESLSTFTIENADQKLAYYILYAFIDMTFEKESD